MMNTMSHQTSRRLRILYPILATAMLTLAGLTTDLRFTQAQMLPNVTATAPLIDLNGPQEGLNFAATYTENEAPVAIVALDMTVSDPDSVNLQSATLQLTDPLDKQLERLAVDTTGTSINAIYNATNGRMQLSNSAPISDYLQVLRTATYVHLSEAPDTSDRLVTFTIFDGVDESAPAVTSVSIQAVNDAPVLDNSGEMRFSPINEDDTTQNGDSVATLLASAGGVRITDVDTGALQGIAVIEVGNSNGQWQYSIDAGSSWTAFGAVSDSAAVLLNTNGRIRFLPNPNFSGQASLTFRAWDQTSGSSGQNGVDVSINGGTAAFSSATETAAISVLPVNDPPLIDLNGRLPGQALTLSFIADQQTVAITAADAVVTDVDSNELTILTVTLLNRPNGSAEALLPPLARAGMTITPYDPTTGKLVLSGAASAAQYSAMLREVRYQNQSTAMDPVTRAIEFVISDGTSANTAVLTNLHPVLANNAPTLEADLIMRFSDVIEDDPNPSGDSVAALLASAAENPVTDPDPDARQGFAVTAVQDENGAWQFSVDAGASWLPFGAVSEQSAVLLSAQSRIRFLPEPDFSGGPLSVTVRAWDQTEGGDGIGGIEVAANGSISTGETSIAVNVLPRNDAPLLTLPDDVIAMFAEDSGPVVVAGPTLGLSDSDSSTLNSATITVMNKVPSEPDILAATTNGSQLTAAYDSAAGILSLTGSAPLADYQAILRSVTFDNSAQDPLEADRLIAFQAGDEDGLSNVVTATVTIQAINDPPVVDLNGDVTDGSDHVVYYDENEAGVGGAVLLAPQMEVEDVDNTSLVSAQLTIEPRPNGAAERLAVSTSGTNITAVFDEQTGNLQLTGPESLANYRKVLRTATYHNLQPFANKALRRVRFSASDALSSSLIHTSTVVVRPQLAFFPVMAHEAANQRSDEPNNICAEAFPLATNVRGQFQANDRNDWYSFSLTSEGIVTVELTNFMPKGGQMLVASGTCTGGLTRIAFNGDFATTKVVSPGRLGAGTYYIWVINDGPTDTGVPYDLRVRVR